MEGGPSEHLLRQAQQAIHDAWRHKNKEHHAELEEWRASQDQVQLQLQQAQHRIAQLEAQLQQSLDEQTNIVNSFRALKERNEHLEAFKKSIVSMVESDDGRFAGSSGITPLKTKISRLESHLASVPTASASIHSPPRVYSNYDTPIPVRDIRTPNRPTPTSARRSPIRLPEADPTTPASHLKPSQVSFNDSSNVIVDVPVDATTFYRQVKQVLEPQQFKLFASNIRMLNAQQQSIEQTLANVKAIFGSQRPFLYSQLVKLVNQAEQELAL